MGVLTLERKEAQRLGGSVALTIGTKLHIPKEHQPWIVITHGDEQVRLRVWKNSNRIMVDFEGPHSFLILRESLINGDEINNKGGENDT